MDKQPKKNYEAIQTMTLDELAEHHTLFLQNFWKFMPLNPSISGLQAFIKDFLLQDAGEIYGKK